MSSSDSKDRFRMEFERLGEGLGHRLGRRFSGQGSQKGGQVGKKLGGTLGGQLGRFSDTLEKETVNPEDQVGVGGKIGTGIGIVGKQFVERRAGSSQYARMAASADLASEGREMGAKVEKIVKRQLGRGIKGLRQRFFKGP